MQNNIPPLVVPNHLNNPEAFDLGSDPKIQSEICNLFLSYVESTGIELYPAQEEAILELLEGHNVILSTPTGSGKSLVALAMHFFSLCRQRRSIYTAPIKALVNEKFLSLCQLFGPDQVGLITGDATVNSSAPIICCTAEILSNMALRQGDLANVDDVIMDEFHYYSDRERGTAWQVPLLTLPQSRFLLMSATMGEATQFEEKVTKLTGIKTVTVTSNLRPVPLEFRYEEYPLEMILEQLVSSGKCPVYLVHFTQNECATTAQALLSVNYLTKEEKQQISALLEGTSFRTPYGKDINRLLRHGVGIHHAGLLPKYRILVEKLAKLGLLKIICGTDTLGVGVNIPIRTVLLTKLCKFDGQKAIILSTRDFHQMAGRAGRKGYDTQGSVLVMAPAHIIENKKTEAKLKLKESGGGKKAKKVVKARPPEKGYVPWDKMTFDRLVNSPPEALTSSFKLSHGMLLNVLGRKSGGLRAMKNILDQCFESPNNRQRLKRDGFLLFRSLVKQKIIEFVPPIAPGESFLRVNLDLQEDFSLMHALSLYLIDTLDKIDPYLEDYGLRVLSLVESIIENPKAILRRQVDKAKKELLLELKQQGVEYEQRMEKLEEVDYPKPLKDFIYDSFNEFSSHHPWVGEENIRPKSIAREMVENFYSFNDYIREYGLERFEGVLLRYLMEIYKVLTQTVPEQFKNESLFDITTYIESLIREVDAGILEEWERLKDPAAFARSMVQKRQEEELQKVEQGILADLNVFTNLVRNAIMRPLRALAYHQWDRVSESLDNAEDWTEEALKKEMEAYFEQFTSILLTPEARSKKHTLIKKIGNIWEVKQKLCDPEGESDWWITFDVNLQLSKELGRPYLILKKLDSSD